MELAHQAKSSSTVEPQTCAKPEDSTLTIPTTGAAPFPATADLDAHTKVSNIESEVDCRNAVVGPDVSFPESTSVSSGDECQSIGPGDEGRNAGEGGRKEPSEARQEKEGKYACMDSAHLHALLHKVDPESAKRLHPRNRRKIVRWVSVSGFEWILSSAMIHVMPHLQWKV